MSDTIYKQDAINVMCNKVCGVDYCGCATDCKEIKEMMELPSAERKGEWIRKIGSLTEAIQKPYCSVCGHSAIGNHGFDCIITNFCPNCGADMRGEEE